MPTANELSTSVLRSLNVIGATESATNAQLLTCYEALQLMIDSWQLDRLLKAATKRTTEDLVASTASITIGTGGDINIVRPVSIEFARIIVDTSADPVREDPIKVFSEQEWADIPDKDRESGRVEGIYYDKTLTGAATLLSTIYVWPVPDTAQRLVIYTPTALAPFADQGATTYEFMPGVEEALEVNLECRVARKFGAIVDQDTRRLAGSLLQALKMSNVQPRTLKFDAALPGTKGYRGDIRRGY